MKTISQFDYIIVGGGLSGLHLSYSFQNDNYFKNHKILVIDNFKSKKEKIIFFHSGKKVKEIGTQF